MSKCGECDGTGDCPSACDDGQLPDTDSDDPHAFVTCGECAGSGRCPDCNGDGDIFDGIPADDTQLRDAL